MADTGEPSEETLAVLIKALGPPEGDFVITVESDDRTLLAGLWGMKGEGIEVQERLQKSVTDDMLGTIYIVLKDAAVFLYVLGKVRETVKAYRKDQKKNSKTKIRTRKNDAKIDKLLVGRKGLPKEARAEVSVAREQNDEEDEGED